MGGRVAPVYVHGLFSVTESELVSKVGNLSFSILSNVVVPVDVEGAAVDKIHFAPEKIGSLVFAACSNQLIITKIMPIRSMTQYAS